MINCYNCQKPAKIYHNEYCCSDMAKCCGFINTQHFFQLTVDHNKQIDYIFLPFQNQDKQWMVFHWQKLETNSYLFLPFGAGVKTIQNFVPKMSLFNLDDCVKQLNNLLVFL